MIVNLLVEAAAFEAAARVNVLPLLLLAARLAGENVAVTPFGNPVTESATVEVNPFSTAVDTLSCVVLPM